jgi:hypothetical protein
MRPIEAVHELPPIKLNHQKAMEVKMSRFILQKSRGRSLMAPVVQVNILGIIIPLLFLLLIRF